MKTTISWSSLSCISFIATALVCFAAVRCFDENDDIYFCPNGSVCNTKWNVDTKKCDIHQNYACCDKKKGNTNPDSGNN